MVIVPGMTDRVGIAPLGPVVTLPIIEVSPPALAHDRASLNGHARVGPRHWRRDAEERKGQAAVTGGRLRLYLYRDVIRERRAHGVEAVGRYGNDAAAGAVRSTLGNEAAATCVPHFDLDGREWLAGQLVDIRDNAGALRGERRCVPNGGRWSSLITRGMS